MKLPLGLIGRKLGMSQIFKPDGRIIPVTIIEAGPCVVVTKRTLNKEGYNAIQLGFGYVKPYKVNKPIKGIFKKAGVELRKYLREFKVDNIEDFEVGQELKVDIFKEGEKVDITGISKGKGFAGPMKRHGFSGGPASHGSAFHRYGSSLGAHTEPGHVFKGKKMAGHMGNTKVTIQNLEVVKVYPERNLLLVKGSVPGSRNSIVLIKKAKKG
ncbi:MAG: 50S ribosomal protein L3 [Synergistetes bacterium]|nr:50S ribosomal protein L3 [Synergistota bacterium]MCX8128070.1 50S ribosomal protein L3 [Synergistota bacterium]MDW8192446.1 50S ribosomal protein L3 [Synergistota bacterium]